MKKAIEKKEWDKVRKILVEHQRYVGDGKEQQHNINDIWVAIQQYAIDLRQISACLNATSIRGHTEDILLIKVNSALECAEKFEKTLKELIRKGRFLK